MIKEQRTFQIEYSTSLGEYTESVNLYYPEDEKLIEDYNKITVQDVLNEILFIHESFGERYYNLKYWELFLNHGGFGLKEIGRSTNISVRQDDIKEITVEEITEEIE